MMYCTRRYDPEKGGVVVSACTEVSPQGEGRFRCFDAFVTDEQISRGGDGILVRAEAFAKGKLQEAMDASNPRGQPS